MSTNDIRSIEAPFQLVLVDDRARMELGNVEDLADAIAEVGQIQSIAVRELTPEELEANPDKLYRLLAGGRRMAAFEHLYSDTPTNVLLRIYPSTLDYLDSKKIELYENTHRKAMTWIEESRLTQDIARLYRELHKIDPALPARPTITELSTERNRDSRSIQTDLKLAEALDAFPELQKCKTRKEALNVLARIEEDLIQKELAKRSERKTAEIPDIAKELFSRYILQDFFTYAATIPAESIDLIELDPPYATDFGSSRDYSQEAGRAAEETRNAAFVEVSPDHFPNFLNLAIQEAHRILKPNGWLLCWFAQEPWAEQVFQSLLAHGFTLKRIPAIWNKQLDSQFSSAPDRYLGRTHETFYYARKGEAQIIKRGRSDVFSYSRVNSNDKVHPTEKPINLMKDILSTFALPGSEIFIPFLGSGNTIIAAHELGMRARGTELSEDFRDRYIIRVEEMFSDTSTLHDNERVISFEMQPGTPREINWPITVRDFLLTHPLKNGFYSITTALGNTYFREGQIWKQLEGASLEQTLES